ncbi:MAG: hypothetical protein KDE56_29675 [Anaerolineales bacterium]|nr:hypothetical protein [Anaerolineales bacterium]
MASIEIQLTSSQIWQAVQQLETADFESLFHDMVALRFKRLVPTVSQDEAALLQTIYDAHLDNNQHDRYEQLVAKLEAETITNAERAEFAGLHDQVEALNVVRLTAVSQLATLWEQPFDTVMEKLGLLNKDVITSLKS